VSRTDHRGQCRCRHSIQLHTGDLRLIVQTSEQEHMRPRRTNHQVDQRMPSGTAVIIDQENGSIAQDRGERVADDPRGDWDIAMKTRHTRQLDARRRLSRSSRTPDRDDAWPGRYRPVEDFGERLNRRAICMQNSAVFDRNRRARVGVSARVPCVGTKFHDRVPTALMHDSG
jgi:hypothetical protein